MVAGGPHGSARTGAGQLGGTLGLGMEHLPGDRDGHRLRLGCGPGSGGPWMGSAGLGGAGDQLGWGGAGVGATIGSWVAGRMGKPWGWAGTGSTGGASGP